METKVIFLKGRGWGTGRMSTLLNAEMSKKADTKIVH